MWLKDIIHSKKWFFMSLSAAIAIPGITVIVLSRVGQTDATQDRSGENCRHRDQPRPGGHSWIGQLRV